MMLKKVSVAAAVIVLAVLLFSCGKDSAIKGKWETDVPFEKIIVNDDSGNENEGYSAMLDAIGADFSDVTVKITFEFFGDGKYRSTIDGDDLRSALGQYYNAVFEYAAEAYGTPIDEVIAAAGFTSAEDAADKAMAKFQTSAEGEYEYSNGTLKIGGKAVEAEASSDSLTINKITSESAEIPMIRPGLLPLKFHRA